MAKTSPSERMLLDLFRQLNGDERDVMMYVASRLVTGRTRYGALHAYSDSRDFRKEAVEELLDYLVYGTVWHMRLSRKSRKDEVENDEDHDNHPRNRVTSIG